MSALGVGVCSWGRMSASGGGVVFQHALRQTPPVDRMTDRCKNTTLATTSLRQVKNMKSRKLWPMGGRGRWEEC